MDSDGIMTKKEACEWGDWIVNSIRKHVEKETKEMVTKNVTKKVTD